MVIKMTEGTARAIGQDAANWQMRQAGRKIWNREDYCLAIMTFRSLWPADQNGFDDTTLDKVLKEIKHE